MASAQPAFGGMFRQLIELGVIEINTEPLDEAIERRLKQFWENTSCPRCGHHRMMTSEARDRVRCRDCNFKPVYTYGTPFHEKHLSCGEVLLAFLLYADTLLSINQIAPLLNQHLGSIGLLCWLRAKSKGSNTHDYQFAAARG